MPAVLSTEMGAVLEASIKDLEKQMEKTLEENQPEHARSFYELPQRFNPENCIISKHRLCMLCALEVGGMPALAKYLYAYARKRIEKDDNMFKYFITDEESQSPGLPLILSTIHPAVLEGLIRGDIPHRCATNRDYARIVQQTTELLSTAGIYLNLFCRKEADPDAATQASSPAVKDVKHTHAGKGFSINQMKSMLKSIKLYLARNSPESLDHARLIDRNPASQAGDQYPDYAKDPKARRYRENYTQEKKIKVWMETHQRFIDKAEQYVEKNPSKAAVLNEPLTWCIPGVGYGRSCAPRSLEHLPNTGTSALLGIVNATQMVLFPGQFKIQQYQIVYITKAKWIDLSEAVISVIAESYHDLGVGVNGVRAGGTSGWDKGYGPQGMIDNTVLLFRPVGRRQVSFRRCKERDRKVLDLLNGWFETEKTGTLPTMKALQEERKHLEEGLKTAVERLRRKARAMDLVELGLLIERWTSENRLPLGLSRIGELVDEDAEE